MLSERLCVNSRLTSSAIANRANGKPSLSGYRSFLFPQPTRIRYSARKPTAAMTAYALFQLSCGMTNIRHINAPSRNSKFRIKLPRQSLAIRLPSHAGAKKPAMAERIFSIRSRMKRIMRANSEVSYTAWMRSPRRSHFTRARSS